MEGCLIKISCTYHQNSFTSLFRYALGMHYHYWCIFSSLGINADLCNFYQQLGLIDRNADAAVIRATDYANEADRACRTKMRDAKSKYRLEDLNLPYICMDLVYLYTILVDGLGTSFKHLNLLFVHLSFRLIRIQERCCNSQV